jgi:hypothetical protein
MTEATVVRKIRDWLHAQGCWTTKTHGSAASSGLPDIIGCYRGRFFGLEVKLDPREGPTAKQQYILNEIAAAGGIAACVHSVEEAKRALDPTHL